jgi:non-specific serine/threonine protein kinase
VAGHLAGLLTPAGLDPEASLMAALLQRLGHLLLLYHFPEEAVQIERLVAGATPPTGDRRSVPAMGADTAALAVLGVRLDELAVAVAHHWGLDDEIQQILQPLSPQAPVLTPSSTEGWLRLIASCANEAVDATARAPSAGALQQVVTRYTKVLGLDFNELVESIQTARRRSAGSTTATGDSVAANRPAD